MKTTTIKKINLILVSLLITPQVSAFQFAGTSFFNPRSQSTNTARDLVGWHTLINRYDAPHNYGALAITPSFGQILRQHRVAEAIWGTDALTITGSLVPNRSMDDVLADYFGLSPAFNSTVQFEPFIRTGQLDFAGYFAWDNFYFQFHAPIVWTRWQFGFNEVIEDDGASIPFPPQYMSNGAIFAPAKSFGQATQGHLSFGDVHDGLLLGTFGCPHSKAGLSDLEMELGWNVVNRWHGYAGFGLRVSAPTGTRPKSAVLFEPIVGNGKHWEVGGSFQGRVLLWEEGCEQELSFYTKLNMMTLLRARQRRAFDFIVNGLGSRYILLKEFDDSGQYTRNSLPAVNVTTLACDASNSLQIDFSIMFGYTYRNFLFDLGYNVWFRSHDILVLRQCLPLNKYALKGIQNVTTVLGQPDNATQSMATLNGNNLSNQSFVADPFPPVFVNTQDLDISSAAEPRMVTQKLFGHIGWVGHDYYCNDVVPYLGLGGELEFEGINRRFTNQPSKNTLSQWTIWVKGGIGF